jgi:hypothetical protein
VHRLVIHRALLRVTSLGLRQVNDRALFQEHHQARILEMELGAVLGKALDDALGVKELVG